MKYIVSTLILMALSAQVVFAQELEGVISIADGLGTLVNALIPIAFAAGLLFFFWGVAVFILNAGNDEKRKAGKGMMLGGVIALFIMASILGIIDFIGRQIGIEQGGEAMTPRVEFE